MSFRALLECPDSASRAHQCEQHATRDHARHLPRRIGAHRVHEQVVLEILFVRHALHDRHGCGDGEEITLAEVLANVDAASAGLPELVAEMARG